MYKINIVYCFSNFPEKYINIDVENDNKILFLRRALLLLTIDELSSLTKIYCYQTGYKSYNDILYFIKQSDFGMFYFDTACHKDNETKIHNKLRNNILKNKRINS